MDRIREADLAWTRNIHMYPLEVVIGPTVNVLTYESMNVTGKFLSSESGFTCKNRRRQGLERCVRNWELCT